VKALVVRLGALGDIVHTGPAVSALVDGGWEVHWAVEARHRPLLDLFALPIHVVATDWMRPGAALAGLKRLRGEAYDVALDFQGLLKSAMVARGSGARRVVGFEARTLREPAARWLYTEHVDPGDHGHVIAKNLALVRHLGLPAERFRLPLKAEQSSVEAAVRIECGGQYAVLNPGAGWPNKQWPPDRFGEIAARIRDGYGWRSVVVWGPGERGLAESVVAAARDSAICAPPTTLADLLALLAGGQVVVAGDTGPIHLAAAAGAPIVGIYGPTDPHRNGPWSPDDLCVSRFDRCRCHHKRRCIHPPWCLESITIDEVMAAVNERIARGPST
jgi:lipopolysaccharide heptosyltransferase I